MGGTTSWAGEGEATDAWGRPPAPHLPLSGQRGMLLDRAVLAILRGFLFIPGALFALVLSGNLAYFGENMVWLLLQLAMVPASVVGWVQASRGKAGDRWTIGYLFAWGVLLTVVAPIANLLDS